MNIYFRIINFAISKMNITGDKRDIEDNLKGHTTNHSRQNLRSQFWSLDFF